MDDVRALIFDVFGTVVDWRTCVAREAAALARAKGVELDGEAFADAWRALYGPSMARVSSGERPFEILDVLHRESLDALLPRFGLELLGEEERAELNRAWHRLDPWPDVIPGLERLKRRFVVSPFSNGNVALLLNMGKRAGIPWDLILGAETSGAYKPLPESYLGAVRMLGLEPRQVLMVAAHNGDLEAASRCGLPTAFVPRPLEFGPAQATDLEAERPWDVVADDFVDLAVKLGA